MSILVVAQCLEEIVTRRDDMDVNVYEQSTVQIWVSIGRLCRSLLQQADVTAEAVKGIGFDTTCSLAVVAKQGETVSVTRNDHSIGKEKNDIVLWCDHRAVEEANLINASKSPALAFMGGSVCLFLS